MRDSKQIGNQCSECSAMEFSSLHLSAGQQKLKPENKKEPEHENKLPSESKAKQSSLARSQEKSD